MPYKASLGYPIANLGGIIKDSWKVDEIVWVQKLNTNNMKNKYLKVIFANLFNIVYSMLVTNLALKWVQLIAH